MAGKSQLFSLYRLHENGETEAALFAVSQQANGQVDEVEFQYKSSYLTKPDAIPILPNMPLSGNRYQYKPTREGLPGFIDELLPDGWGHRFSTRIFRIGKVGSRYDVIDLLSIPVGSVLGGFVCGPYGAQMPSVSDGVSWPDMERTVGSAIRFDRNQTLPADSDVLVQSGAYSLKGMRPKIVMRNGNYWLVKLARMNDSYDIIAAEYTALGIARTVGLQVPRAKIVAFGGEKALLVERFDRVEKSRHHIFSANSLLKDPLTHEDRLHSSYEEIADLIRRYSSQPLKDLWQLLGQMLLNSVLNNIDDHLRNFSFVVDQFGVRLSPAYDIVPSPVMGHYHQLAWDCGNTLPDLDQAETAAAHLGIPRRQGRDLAERIESAMERHRDELRAAGALPC